MINDNNNNSWDRKSPLIARKTDEVYVSSVCRVFVFRLFARAGRLENFRHGRSGKLVIRKNYFALISREMRKSWIVISTVKEWIL